MALKDIVKHSEKIKETEPQEMEEYIVNHLTDFQELIAY